jgi:sugar phosphate permease
LTSTKKRADIEPASKNVSFMEILAIPRLKMLMLSYFFVKIVRYCLLFWLPFYLSQEYKMSVAVAGYMSCIYDLGGVLGGLACGIIGDKYFEGKRTVLGALSCALLTFAIGLPNGMQHGNAHQRHRHGSHRFLSRRSRRYAGFDRSL